MLAVFELSCAVKPANNLRSWEPCCIHLLLNPGRKKTCCLHLSTNNISGVQVVRNMAATVGWFSSTWPKEKVCYPDSRHHSLLVLQ
ncbi:hypothetical protein Pmani_011324 [Petrolisthes manimaculis]|uniref:Uncharacterized protein n=1 Tax=Petrolisthes manimaculis TaxID=1843537 RepID=A0AAE1Q0C1_9EUCA|nr:hypothetical protein Pmani_011324 [Petrolisthes manimaculis]